MDLKIKLGGKEYTAPPPKTRQLKEYFKLLRAIERAKAAGTDEDIDAEFAFLAALFDNPAVTAAALDELSFGEASALRMGYASWLAQYMPEGDAKNGKAR